MAQGRWKQLGRDRSKSGESLTQGWQGGLGIVGGDCDFVSESAASAEPCIENYQVVDLVARQWRLRARSKSGAQEWRELRGARG